MKNKKLYRILKRDNQKLMSSKIRYLKLLEYWA